MKLETDLIEQTKPSHKPGSLDRAGIALSECEALAQSMRRHLAIIKPEVEAVEADSGKFYAERVLDGYLSDQTKAREQLAIELRALIEDRQKLASCVGPLAADAKALSDDMHRAVVAVYEIAKERARTVVEAFFDAVQVEQITRETRMVKAAMLLVTDSAGRDFGASIEMTANRNTLSDCRNTAAEVVGMYRAQIRHWETTHEGITAWKKKFLS